MLQHNNVGQGGIGIARSRDFSLLSNQEQGTRIKVNRFHGIEQL